MSSQYYFGLFVGFTAAMLGSYLAAHYAFPWP